MEKTFIKITPLILKAIKKVIAATLEYETFTKRIPGITGEVGEILVCHKLGLSLSSDSINAGYDAMGKNGKKYQIKTRRIFDSKIKGRLGSFAKPKHKFDFAILALLNERFEIVEIWRMNYKKTSLLVGRYPKRNPPASSFISNAEKI